MKHLAMIVLIVIIVSSFASPVWAALINPEGRNLTTAEIALSTGALVFTVIVIIVAAWMRVRQVMSSDITFKMIGLAVTN